ncbi:NB-ARC domain-containing protein [Leptolyngbya sp. CCNP1308]|uniref:NB-ARC domain-containing protein n=1 Tax=Leptolyngbya sp. CCNP1308 TaxID=3110255 RepID=UPI002B1FCA78|nr:NB-ARC domain-containing protein [Leptolyngbya sp. CCNP1308]MEA5448379.1 NB-ARC domain-containing protein [Leptolyngbya sp. CCNP1308]
MTARTMTERRGGRRDRLKASLEGLQVVDQAMRQRGWGHQSAVWYDRAHVSLGTLRRFWQRIPIRAESFVAICEAAGVDWQQVIASDAALAEPSSEDAYGVTGWVGRVALLDEVVQRCQQGCRLLFVTGMTGVGKTALVDQVCQRLEAEFADQQWVKFDGRDRTEFAQVAPCLAEGTSDLAAVSAEEGVAAVVQALTSQPKLVVLDGLEATLQGNEEIGWSEFKDIHWGHFFKRLLAAQACQSVVLVTSQEFPAVLRAVVSRDEAAWHGVNLKGLEPAEREQLFAALGLDGERAANSQAWLRRIGAAYEGHPLALKVIAGEILAPPFDGNLAAYWNTYGDEIEQLEQSMQAVDLESEDDPLRLDCYTRQLRQIVRQRIETSFQRLQQEVPLAYQLLCLGSVYRRPVVEAFWLNLLAPFQAQGELSQLMLEALLDRYLVEETVEHHQLHLRQHNVIRSIALSHLRQIRPRHDPPAASA